jgi:hypothetical protein
MASTANPSPTLRLLDRIVHGRNLAAHLDRGTARRGARASDRRINALRHPSQVLACNVSGERQHPETIASIVLTRNGAVIDFGKIPDQRVLRLLGHHWNISNVFERRDFWLGILYLHLIRDARLRIGPVVRSGETA